MHHSMVGEPLALKSNINIHKTNIYDITQEQPLNALTRHTLSISCASTPTRRPNIVLTVSMPHEQIVIQWSSSDILQGILFDFLVVLQQSLPGL